VLASPEAVGLAVARDYATYLRRPRDAGGWQYWVPRVLAGPAPTQAAALALLSSDAYYRTTAEVAEAGQATLVKALYRDVQGRAADPAGVSYWVGLLQAGRTQAQVATALWQSPEHRALLVEALYRQLLHRPADALAQAYWGGQLLAGQSEEQVAARILASPEYYAAHPDAAAFVNGLFADVLGRALDGAGAAYWEGLLQVGASRQEVAAAVLASPEAVGMGLARDYAAYLRRPLDPAGWQYWVPRALASPAPTEAAALALLASEAYFQAADALAGA
jgi:hypothetical protein